MWSGLTKWHRWLGLGLGWLMMIWFISGAVMMFVSLPRAYTSAEGRAARSPALPAEAVRLGFGQAWRICGQPDNLVDARLAMLAGRPAYFFRAAGGYRVVWADSGRMLGRVTPALALSSAQWSTGRAGGLKPAGMVTTDQWTVGTGGKAHLRPYYKFEADGPGGVSVYVSSKTGEVCQVTDTSGRVWAWLGAIPHWLYFTVLRSHLETWRWTIIVLAALGCVLCLSGLWLGVRLLKFGGWGRGKYARSTPYLGWRKWHHYLGLIFGLPALTWTFSGMLSLSPFDWHTPSRPDRQMVRAVSGGPPSPPACRLEPALALKAMAGQAQPTMLRLISFQGLPYFLGRAVNGQTRLTPAWAEQAEVMEQLPGKEMLAAAQGLLPGQRVARADLLVGGDLYLPKAKRPLWKVVYNDPAETWLYLDPGSGRIAARLDDSGRLNRWLYRFLHCLDLPWLVEHRVVRDAIMLVLLAGGSLLCFSGPWSWLARRGKKRRRRTRPLGKE